ncbi:hypothetical protein EPD60_08710 [Flaviaesturariibacter flavus]|uniref:Uncharacterized protein n=1 Tax=Flaviaesturariibacter flavus TaxID=2502780 RepID=A0A4R1BAV4_9BACT|nr:hypothetical protein [Flaviaesturariibacter flavus]TCJ14083.1 hypothetical protein EPD60_08710 [Flaviaesturariibacter flavus]
MLAFYGEWERLREAQQGTEGDLGEHRSERDEARVALEDACYEALLQVARSNKRNPDAARRYFDHTLLDPAYTPSLRKQPTA